MCAQQNSVQSSFTARSVRDVVTRKDTDAQNLTNRSFAVDGDFVHRLVNNAIMRWEGRSPRPAFDAHGAFRATDLDLLSFLVPLAERQAILEIPEYTNRRGSVRRVHERKIGKGSFGQAVGLVSNQNAFSFSVRLRDQSIVVRDEKTEKEKAGAFRAYMLVDVDGTWHDGWKRIAFNPTAKENSFLNSFGLLTRNAVSFKYSVHPNRRQSIYGAPYLRLKMLDLRLRDEASFYASEMKRLSGLGVELPRSEGTSAPLVESMGETRPLLVETLEMVLDMPDFSGQYKPVADSEEGMKEAYERQKYLRYTLRPIVQFVIRADEAAFFLFGAKQGFVASWMKTAEWESRYRLPRGRINWNRLVLSPGVGLRYRIKTITEQVAVTS